MTITARYHALTMIADWINQSEAAVSAWAAALGWPAEALFRLVIAAAAGGVIGLEREIRVRHAGFRTLMLVCVGSALAMLISIHFAQVTWPEQLGENRIAVDPARIAYGIMTGIGFLGAGTIIQRHSQPQGLTTAAAIWCIAAIGMAIGLGLFVLALTTTLCVLIALWLLDYIELLIPRRHTREVTVRTRYTPTVLEETLRHFRRPDLEVLNAGFSRSTEDDACDLTVTLAYNTRRQPLTNLEPQLEAAGLRVLRSREV